MGTIGSLQSYFAMGFARGVGQMTGMLGAGQVSKADFNQLYVKAISDTKGGLEFKDLQNLARVLKEVEPDLYKQFQKKAKDLGADARRAVKGAFDAQGKYGPLGPPKATEKRKLRTFDRMYTNGRLSWGESKSKRNVIDVTWREPKSKNLSKYATAGDKTISLVRVRVRGGSYILADMAGKSGKAKRYGQLSRPYKINLFGKIPITNHQHRISGDNVENWLTKLNEHTNSASRFAWPAMQGHQKNYRANVSNLVAEVIMETNRKLNS